MISITQKGQNKNVGFPTFLYCLFPTLLFYPLHKVQRDLYSAFLLRNSNKELNKPDRAKCICEFDRFLKLQNCLLTEMKENGISMKQCFGF